MLTEDNACPPNVALWDVTKAKQVSTSKKSAVDENTHQMMSQSLPARLSVHLGLSASDGRECNKGIPCLFLDRRGLWYYCTFSSFCLVVCVVVAML